jgi:3-oxoacyl-[acyl-carrier protein] reductase
MVNMGTLIDLAGRVAIVTGAGSGIGRGSAEILGAAGASVVCADVSGPGAETTAESIRAAGGNARAAVVDVSHREQVADLVAGAVADHGRLDVMCNNAGIIIDVAVLDLSEEQLDQVLAVNLKGVLFGCQEAGRVMSTQGSGSIVNMASGAVDGPTPGLVAYGISKVGVVALTRTLAAELGSRHVRVNAIAPGLIETNITRRHYLRQDGTVDEARREAVLAPTRARTPLGFIGAPEDVGWAVLYLASDASRFVTGQILRPNGGTSMPW